MAIELRTFTGEDRDAVIWSVCLKWWKEFEPGVDDYTKSCSVYDVTCGRQIR